MHIKSYSEFIGKNVLFEAAISTSDMKRIVWEVIARKGKSKDYDNFNKDHLNKTFIGVLHFTGSGLRRLYKEMGDSITKKYFGKNVKTMISEIPKYLMWEEASDFNKYRENWKSFLKSEHSVEIQDRVAYKRFSEDLNKTPFSTLREYAIGISIHNSSPAQLFKFGKMHKWDAEKMMLEYCKFHCNKRKRWRTRCRELNANFPAKEGTKGYVFTATSCSELKKQAEQIENKLYKGKDMEEVTISAKGKGKVPIRPAGIIKT